MKKNLIVLGCILLVTCSALAQISLNVTSYGAAGDAVQFAVKTTANSSIVSVVGTNRFTSADIGKVIEVFRASTILSAGVTNQDTIGIITNVVNGTNLYSSIPQQLAKTAYCIVGRNNASNFQNCINAAQALVTGAVTNVTINIPDGIYLLISSNAMDPKYVMPTYANTASAFNITSGGLTLLGNSTNAVLMGCGAGMNHPITYPGYYSTVDVFRGNLVFVQCPMANPKYPLVFQNLTMDGGLTNGMQSYQYFNINTADGSGWDVTHDALFWVGTGQAVQRTVFTNCVVQHWRGEMIKGNGFTGGTNTFIDVANCTFYDGNASALNPDFAYHIHGCAFVQMVKVLECYASRWTAPSVFEYNTFSKISGIGYTLCGSLKGQFQQPALFQSNYCDSAGISIGPGENFTIRGNIFTNGQVYINFQGFMQPSDGTQSTSSNIVITANSFYGGPAVYFTGQPAESIFVTNNSGCNILIAGGSDTSAGGGGYKTNIVFANNDNSTPFFCGYGHNALVDCRNLGTGTYFVDTNNGFCGQKDFDGTGKTSRANILSYALGSFRNITATLTNSIWFLDDSQSQFMPQGAQMTVFNSTGVSLPVYASSDLSTTPVVIPTGTQVIFNWVNGSWAEGALSGNFNILTVTSGTGSGAYAIGDVVSVTAKPVTGKIFKLWSGATNILVNPFAATTSAIVPAGGASIMATYNTTPPTNLHPLN